MTQAPVMAPSYITIGLIVSVVGLRGEVKCALMTDFPERFFNLEAVWIETKEGRQERLHIERVRSLPPFVYLTFDDISSREQAEPFINARIQIPEEERFPLPADHYYQYEIEGLSVYLEEGGYLGRIESILETGGNDVYLVAGCSAPDRVVTQKQDRREYLIPAIKSVVKKIDLVKKEMTISPMKGLLEL